MAEVVAEQTSFEVSQDTEKDTITVNYILRRHGDPTVIEYAEALDAMPTEATTYLVLDRTVYLKSRSVSVTENSGMRVWTGTAVWDNAPTSTPALSFVAREMNTSTTGVDFWRAETAPPTNLSNPAQTALTGTPLDANGEPITVQVPQITFTVTNLKGDSQYGTIADLVGRRNSGSFLNIAAGYLLFTGGQSRRVNTSQYEITYTFVYDWYGHCRQVALGDSGGIIMGAETIGSGGVPIRHATQVVWKQPFPATGDFTALGLVT